MAWSPPARERRHCLGFNHPETTPPSIPTTPRTAPSTQAQNELLNWVFRHLAAAGITLVSTESQPNGSPRENIKTAVERAFDIVAIFASLTGGRAADARRENKAQAL